MAQNVFDATFDTNNRIDVNSFDWSHVNNLTTDFGRIRSEEHTSELQY